MASDNSLALQGFKVSANPSLPSFFTDWKRSTAESSLTVRVHDATDTIVMITRKYHKPVHINELYGIINREA